jgi:enoyl-CoA hydratase
VELDTVRGDPEIRCVVITGDTRAFAAGADIDELQLAAQGKFPEQQRQAAWKSIGEFPKPLIAAVNGFALGGGCELMMNADIVIAATTAKFGQPEVNLGLMPGAGGTQRLARLVGKAVAMKLVLSGEIISASEALRIGLISEVVEPEVCVDRSLDLASTIANKAGSATTAIKAAILDTYEVGLVDGLNRERAAFLKLVVADDAAEGIMAFKEKRAPSFPGNK